MKIDKAIIIEHIFTIDDDSLPGLKLGKYKKNTLKNLLTEKDIQNFKDLSDENKLKVEANVDKLLKAYPKLISQSNLMILASIDLQKSKLRPKGFFNYLFSWRKPSLSSNDLLWLLELKNELYEVLFFPKTAKFLTFNYGPNYHKYLNKEFCTSLVQRVAENIYWQIHGLYKLCIKSYEERKSFDQAIKEVLGTVEVDLNSNHSDTSDDDDFLSDDTVNSENNRSNNIDDLENEELGDSTNNESYSLPSPGIPVNKNDLEQAEQVQNVSYILYSPSKPLTGNDKKINQENQQKNTATIFESPGKIVSSSDDEGSQSPFNFGSPVSQKQFTPSPLIKKNSNQKRIVAPIPFGHNEEIENKVINGKLNRS